MEQMEQSDSGVDEMTEKSGGKMYARGDVRIEHVGEIILKDGRHFMGAIITFPAGAPHHLPISAVWEEMPFVLNLKNATKERE